MGIDNSAVVIVGLSVDELGLSEDEVYDLLSEGLDYASPLLRLTYEGMGCWLHPGGHVFVQ